MKIDGKAEVTEEVTANLVEATTVKGNIVGTSNIGLAAATTTNANDSIKITSADGTALSSTNKGIITLTSTSSGLLSTLEITSDVTIDLTGAHWGHGTTGDLANAILRVLALNDNGTLRWGVAYLGGRHTVLTTDTNATQTNINLPEEILCDIAVGSATNSALEVGFFRANFDDTGGAAEDLWAVQTGVGDIVVGRSPDGLFQPFNSTFTGFSSGPTVGISLWTQIGRTGIYKMFQTAGTSDATDFTATLPFKSNLTETAIGAVAVNNSTFLGTNSLRIDTSAGSTTLTLFPDDSALNLWTGSGAKWARFTIELMVGPAASFIG